MREIRIPTPRGELHALRCRPGDSEATGSPIVLMHDSLGCVALWRDFPIRLAEATGREVIAYDRLGYGRSAPYPGPQPSDFIEQESASFDAVRKQLVLDRFVMLGHSVGGCMAVEIAAHHADGCEALVTVAAQAFTEPRTLDGIRKAQRDFAEPRRMARLATYHGDKAEWVLRSWVETWHSEAFAHWTLDEALRRVACPTLAIHGEHDEFGSLAQPRRIAALTPGPSEPTILPDCGHVPHRECPERLIDAICPFLDAPASA
ncbi:MULTISPECIES: alpha/beta fold hydrolase [Halomonas]|uniref:Pimeloyl-ACP methyl ester carboxylesterase n=1 Tax=Halomonas ventosae TaxID=229007 RepID=A0A4R6I528_9GAMM|nr:alpha/beta hydrolase [Halomonas ventosae]TDO16544.1 pimeloyl-ACP methyl ester carboxylesterase [Halomonas ventosae]